MSRLVVGKRWTEFQRAAVARIRDVEVAAPVHRNTVGRGHAVRARYTALIETTRNEIRLPDHDVGGGAGKRRLVFEYAAVVRIGDVERAG